MTTLADQIVRARASNAMLLNRAIRVASDEIGQAQRFSISDDARDATRNVILSRPTTLIEALVYARPPFQKTWFEWNPRSGQRALNTAQIRPKRIGAMVTAINPAAWTMWTAWSYDIGEATDHARTRFGAEVAELVRLNDPGVAVSAMLLGIDLAKPIEAPSSIIGPGWAPLRGIAGLPDEELAKLRNDQTNPVRYVLKDQRERAALEALDRRMGYRVNDLESLELSTAYGKDGIDAAILDVQEEIAPMLATMILMNSKNCVEIGVVDPPEKLNRARIRRGQPPLLGYSTVHISLSRVQRNAAAAKGMGGAEMRLHLVRGHFKLRRTGAFWWSSHPRGSSAHGEVKHDYVIEDA